MQASRENSGGLPGLRAPAGQASAHTPQPVQRASSKVGAGERAPRTKRLRIRGRGQSQELPEGLSRVRFPGTSGKEQPLVTMCRLTSVPGAALFWVAQAMLSWLSGLLDRQPEMGARGLEKVYLRAAPPRAGQDTLPRCPGLAPSRVHRRRKVPGVSAPSADCFAACGRRASLLQLDPCC